MSIPSYQFASLEGENIAKRRVMTKAKKGFETEEQRAVKSGKIGDGIKNIYQLIIANLELQLTTITVAEAFVSTMAYEPVENDEDGIEAERELHSYLIASLGKLVNLASTLYNLIGRLGDEIVKGGNVANPSVDIGKIFTLMDEVDKAYGEYGKTGLNNAFAVMVDVLSERGQPVPQLDGLLEIWEVANLESRTRLEKLQRNEYGVELQSIKIPIREGRDVNPERQANIASGNERRNFSKIEYELLLDLKKKGFLRDDDFTSVYSGDDRSFATGSSYSSDDTGSEEGDSDDDTMSRSASSASSRSRASSQSSGRVFRPTRYARNYFDESSSSSSGSGLYSIPLQPHPVN
jgi:hypothetical protein